MTDALREGFELGGYRIEATTGSQATGTIYRATQFATGETVALHLIAERLAKDAVFRERFHRELADPLRAVEPVPAQGLRDR